MSFKNFFSSYKSIFGFLILLVLAVVSFTFGNVNDVFYLITAALSICAFFFAFSSGIDKKDYIRYLPLVAGLFIISGIAAFGGLSHSFSPFSNIATFFAIPAFFSLGFFIRRFNSVKIEYFIFAIGFGLAAITLVSTIITWSQYGIFYAEIHKAKPIYYYSGVTYNVTEEMGWLMGFKVSEVCIEYGGVFGILCAVFLPALLFLRPKENRSMFISSAVIGGIGLISLLTVPNWKAIILLVIVSIFAFVYKFLKEKMLVVNILSVVVVGLIGLAALFFLLSVINAGIGYKFPGILNRIFVDNSVMNPVSKVLSAAFAKDINGSAYNLIGFNLENPSAGIIDLQNAVKTNTYIFEYEVIKEVGLIGTIFVVALLVTIFVFTVFYIRDSKDSAFMKNILVMLLFAFLLYSSFGFNPLIETHSSNSYQCFLRSAPFMISLMLFGMMYFTPKENARIEEASL